MLTKKNRVWAAAALLTVVGGLTSCLKNNNTITNSRTLAQIWVLNTSNSTTPATFYDNGQKISGDTAVNFNFYSRYGVYSGTHTFQLKKMGGDSLITSTSPVTFDSSYYYTYIIFNNPVQSIVTQNDLTTASQTKINIRCFNLSQPENPSDKVDFYVGTEKIDSNRATMSMSELAYATKFTQFSNFSINNTVTVKKAGTNVELARNNSLIVGSFNAGNVYTIYYAGTFNSTGKDKPMVNAFPSYYSPYQ
jgi:hypothetical protein